MDKGKIVLTPNVEQSGMLGLAFEQNAGSIPAFVIRGVNFFLFLKHRQKKEVKHGMLRGGRGRRLTIRQPHFG